MFFEDWLWKSGYFFRLFLTCDVFKSNKIEKIGVGIFQKVYHWNNIELKCVFFGKQFFIRCKKSEVKIIEIDILSMFLIPSNNFSKEISLFDGIIVINLWILIFLSNHIILSIFSHSHWMNTFMIFIRKDINFSWWFLKILRILYRVFMDFILCLDSLNEALECIVFVDVKIVMLLAHGFMDLCCGVVCF